MTMNRIFALGVFCTVLSLPAQASNGMGLTWGKDSSTGHNSTYGVDHVGCGSCNPYTGDTSCSASLPVLCIKQDWSPKPSGLYTDYYNGWASGHISTTLPIQGWKLTSLAAADQLCADSFGAGWRMASFHDGSGGWSWYAYGNVRSDMRFWLYIKDQPGNCWN